MTKPTPEEALAAARALVAEADAQEAADRQAKTDAATAAVKDLVASPEFKVALPSFEEALLAAPRDTELLYAVQMMERLRDRFPA